MEDDLGHQIGELRDVLEQQTVTLETLLDGLGARPVPGGADFLNWQVQVLSAARETADSTRSIKWFVSSMWAAVVVTALGTIASVVHHW